jgi:hypothetical protein
MKVKESSGTFPVGGSCANFGEILSVYLNFDIFFQNRESVAAYFTFTKWRNLTTKKIKSLVQSIQHLLGLQPGNY